MGLGNDSAILHQAKKGQGETNERLDALLDEQRRTNQLLEQLIAILSDQGGTPHRPTTHRA